MAAILILNAAWIFLLRSQFACLPYGVSFAYDLHL